MRSTSSYIILWQNRARWGLDSVWRRSRDGKPSCFLVRITGRAFYTDLDPAPLFYFEQYMDVVLCLTLKWDWSRPPISDSKPPHSLSYRISHAKSQIRTWQVEHFTKTYLTLGPLRLRLLWSSIITQCHKSISNLIPYGARNHHINSRMSGHHRHHGSSAARPSPEQKGVAPREEIEPSCYLFRSK